MTIMNTKFGVQKNESKGVNVYLKSAVRKIGRGLGEVLVILTLKPPPQMVMRDPGRLVIRPITSLTTNLYMDFFREIRDLGPLDKRSYS